MSGTNSEKRSGTWGSATTFLVLALCVLVVFLIAKVWTAVVAARGAAIAAKTMSELNMFTTAAEQFRLSCGRYPTNLNELSSNAQAIVFIDFIQRRATATNDGKFLDSWRRRYLYVPPSASSTGYVGTLGKNGIAGGVGEDTDRFAVLPVPAKKR